MRQVADDYTERVSESIGLWPRLLVLCAIRACPVIAEHFTREQYLPDQTEKPYFVGRQSLTLLRRCPCSTSWACMCCSPSAWMKRTGDAVAAYLDSVPSMAHYEVAELWAEQVFHAPDLGGT